MSLSQLLKANRQTFVALLILFLGPFIFDSLILRIIISEQDYFFQYTTTQWLLFYLVAMFAMSFGITHTTFISIFSGYFLGWSSIPYVVISYLFASILGYFIGKLVNSGKFMNSIMTLPHAEPIARELKRKEFFIILLSRFSPALPFAVTNLLFSILKADFKKYFFAGAVGMLPRTLMFIWAGSQAQTIAEALAHPEKLSSSRIFTLIFLGISILGLYFFIKRAIKKGAKTV